VTTAKSAAKPAVGKVAPPPKVLTGEERITSLEDALASLGSAVLTGGPKDSHLAFVNWHAAHVLRKKTAARAAVKGKPAVGTVVKK
jgi:hypothetical protein